MVGTKKGSGASGKRHSRKGKRKLFHYGTELLVLILLVAAAFFTPQVIFGVQDRILCGDTVLSQRESMNVEMLSATYEKSMAARMRNYAESLAEDENFYLSSQELEITSEIEDYFYGENGFYQQMVEYFVDERWLAEELWAYQVTRWKQYVIYSDNYAKGVNFILWYIEMENEYGERAKLLADAEDGALYAIRSENNTRMWENREINYDIRDYWNDYIASELWCYFMLYYEGLTPQNIEFIVRRMTNETGTSVNGVLMFFRHLNHPEEPYLDELPYMDYYNIMAYELGIETDMGETEISIFENGMEIRNDVYGTDIAAILALANGDIVVGENAGYFINGAGNVSYFLPYGNGHLEVVMETKDMDYRWDLWKAGIFMYPDITIGIREIYEMIPEFA